MIIYDALAVDWQPQPKTCFLRGRVLPMFRPSASARRSLAHYESPASAQFAREFNLGDYLPFKIKKRTLKSAAANLLTELRRGRHASGRP